MAVDRIKFNVPAKKVNEGSRLPITFRGLDFDGDAATPTNFYYRVDCLTTNEALTAWTTAGTAAASMTVIASVTDNAIQDETNALERKQVTVAADYGLSTEYRQTLAYDVINLRLP